MTVSEILDEVAQDLQEQHISMEEASRKEIRKATKKAIAKSNGDKYSQNERQGHEIN
jgi:hypothetical protein